MTFVQAKDKAEEELKDLDDFQNLLEIPKFGETIFIIQHARKGFALSIPLFSNSGCFFSGPCTFYTQSSLLNATRTSARRKSRGSRKKWASWLLEHVKGGKFSVQTTAKIGTNTSPLKLDCCLFSAPRSHSHDRNKIRRQFPLVLSLWVIFGGSSETSKLCVWPQHLVFSCPATVQHMGLSKWLAGVLPNQTKKGSPSNPRFTFWDDYLT